MKKKPKNKSINLQTDSPVIEKIRALLADSENLGWANSLPQNEVKLLYDLEADSQSKRNFIPTEKQSIWALAIIKKIKLTQETKTKK